ncbi:putative Glutaredoxin family protein [Quillaja saponaria]|uniref:Glutaredoxin family protein n=1 Tax=Quillaja saponaria TaxID=32244 RepID=A0AAD7VDJ2_QUISA|nr:putative Glutaredoxin family protein [Quillaja saponaria]
MTGMKGMFLKKLKLIPTISTLKQGLFLHLSTPDIFRTQKCETPTIHEDQDHKNNNLAQLEVGIIGTEDDKQSKEEETERGFSFSNKEKATTSIISRETVLVKENPEVPTFSETNTKHDGLCEAEDREQSPSLTDFKEICPPGGSQSVILYTTSLRGIRKTFKDCNTILFLLKSFKVLFYERDVSMHLEFREELWRILGDRVIPPRLFIKGKYIGGADEVVGLHELGKLRELLEGIPIDLSNCTCNDCANMRFVVCFNCSGGCKVFNTNGEVSEYSRCTECNENGLVKCPTCC